MTTIHARHALLPDGWAENVRVAFEEDGRIESILMGQDSATQRGVVQVGILLPAMANLHSHSFQRAMAGRTEFRAEGRDSFWTWRELMYRFTAALTPDQIEAIANLVFMEMLEAGYASVGEFHYLHHLPGGTAYDDLAETSLRIFAAANTSGIGLTHLPVLYTFGGAGEKPLGDAQARFGNDGDRFVALVEAARAGADKSLPADARVGIAPHSLRATSPELLREMVTHFVDGPIHIHIAEQPREVEDVSEWLGVRPVEWLLRNLDVDGRWCLVHATHMTDAETVALAKSGAVAGLCSITEANLGDGPFNGPTYLAAGGAIGLGSDSNVRISLAEEIRMLEYSQRLRDVSRNVMLAGEGSVGESLYRRCLAGGAQALGRDSGAIAVGQLADLVALDGGHLVFAGLDPEQFLDGWIFGGDDRVVRDVWSAGRHMVRDGRHIERDKIEAGYRKAIATLMACQ
jgi:formimidoylglutamate deiminase